ncbi:methyltransferase domain-containing protein [Aestuariibaculum sp. M13]|uniref:methyltransferase domain-containing protein n=1 Tax=Aestuariibaculum sp. M13 TaxID=2967132 RepID=UPI002159F14C|nr:methyltransferase domain-containing protein [Aestuariibaculum sp. M13]MCR8666457.1 methyltransferase domain-containing protein [Aestuariibaculum sp. M13]
MYDFIKNSIAALIPKKLLFENELFFRSVYSLLYLGNNHTCNICNYKLRKFIRLKNGDLLCPSCGSLSRNRRLWKLLNDNHHITGNILHFSPSRSLYRNLKKIESLSYFSTDYEDEFLAEYKFDITDINQENSKFDTVICYHILEHIVDDLKAMKELYRVLNSKGTIYIQTPFKEGDIYEDESVVTPEERNIHFGQHDHVRVYSIKGLKLRLEQTGFKVKVVNFLKTDDDVIYGFLSPETTLIVTK